jgi:hypothetical protein
MAEDISMNTYEVRMSIETDDSAEQDPEITKAVEAKDDDEALVKARKLVQVENPEHNHRKIWSWGITQIYS